MSDYREEMARACFGANGNLMPWRDAPEKLRDGWRAVADDVISQLPDSLDAAWAEAEATRRGWVVQGLHAFVEETSEHGVITGWEAQAMDPLARFSERGEGPTPAAALRALAAKLRMLPVVDTTR
jgi:hypothetical protein